MKCESFPKPVQKSEQGFSLLELMIVTGLMIVAATLALSTIGSQDAQERFDTTRKQLTIMREAILGTPLIQGEQINLNGFINDMGRLPQSIRELVQAPTDCDGDIETDSDGDADPSNDFSPCSWTYNREAEMWHGWRGPYVEALNGDFRDGWGNGDPIDFNDPDNDPYQGWSWVASSTPVDGVLLTIASNASDNGDDIYEPEEIEAIYGDPALQQVTFGAHEVNLQFPATQNIALPQAPFCGQCVDYTYTNQIDCEDNSQSWDANYNVCVRDPLTITSASDCDDTETNRLIKWLPLYGYCSIPGYSTQANCEAAIGSWTPLNAGTCASYPPHAAFDFTEGNTEACVRIIHVNHGKLSAQRYKTSNASAIAVAQNSTGEENTANLLRTFETNNAEETDYLEFAKGKIRFGLFVHDPLETTECTETPYPSARGQALSDIITLTTLYPPNIGSPISLRWRSQ